ncbi:MAG: glycosyltransferase family 39 protein [Candidatus Jorgensenbacteria bacterium]
MTNRLKNSSQIILVIAILGISFGLMWNAAKLETAIFDETAHIPAGYGYVKYLDYRLNPEHPPLVKALSAIPLLFMDLNFPLHHPAWTDDVNGQWETGAQFFYGVGNDADQIVVNSRIFPIILTLLTIILIYIWSRELLGNWWALLPAYLFGLSPIVLAHGHYVTTDVGAALGVLFAVFGFTKFLARPRAGTVILAGLALGVALLAKFSNNLLIPYLILLAIIYFAFFNRKNFFKYLKGIIGIFLIALVLIYAVYFVFTLNYPAEKQLTDASVTLAGFSPRWLADFDLTLIENPVLRPVGQYLFGLLMILQRAAGGNTAYFLGELSANGWWYYFPVVFLLKEPLPSLILIFFALGLGLRKIFRGLKGQLSKVKSHLSNYLGTHFPEFAMLLFVVIYWAYSIQSSLNIGVRHLIPTLPFIYILASGAIKSWFSARPTAVKSAFLSIILVWFVAETAVVSPHFLSYFNELGGGTRNGYHWVTDSNYDWGQDLKFLKKFVDERGINKIAIDYFGGGSPKYHLGEETAENWWSARGNPKDIGIEWLAVSLNTLAGAHAKLDSDLERKPEDEYSFLRGVEPFARAGESIFIYKF